MQIKKAVYDYGFALPEQYKPTVFSEIAVAGKSNVGKSSFINMLCANGKLSRVGATPGKTILINAFKINDSFYLMDLPGYGYARVSENEKLRWSSLLEGYLGTSQALKGVVLLLDIRHEIGEGDRQMINWLSYYQIPFIIGATKADKLSKAQIHNNINMLSRGTGIIANQIVPVSAVTRAGKDEILLRMEELLSR